MLRIVYKVKVGKGNPFVKHYYDLEYIPEVIAFDDNDAYYEIDRKIIEDEFNFLKEVASKMVGGIYYIADHEMNEIHSFKVSGLSIIDGKVLLSGMDEENKFCRLDMKTIALYYKK